MAAVAWVLNLDADVELAARGSYTPTSSVLAAMRTHAERLAATLLGPEDVLVDDGVRADGLPGRAFCPTPRAIALLQRAGAIPEPHPAASVLRRVNARAFCAELGQTLPGAAFQRDLAAAIEQLRSPPPLARHWRIKRNHGMAGRGQWVVRDVEAARDFLRAGIAEGGVQIEPNVDIEKEYALHAMLAPDGSTERGRLLEQRSDAHGAWIESRPIDAPDLERRLVEEIDRVATALHAAGYFGPFGVDAFAYAGGFQPRSEINARYSMAFALGFQGKSWPASPSSSLSASSR